MPSPHESGIPPGRRLKNRLNLRDHTRPHIGLSDHPALLGKLSGTQRLPARLEEWAYSLRQPTIAEAFARFRGQIAKRDITDTRISKAIVSDRPSNSKLFLPSSWLQVSTGSQTAAHRPPVTLVMPMAVNEPPPPSAPVRWDAVCRTPNAWRGYPNELGGNQRQNQ